MHDGATVHPHRALYRATREISSQLRRIRTTCDNHGTGGVACAAGRRVGERVGGGGVGRGSLLKRAALTKGSPDDEHAREARISSSDALNETARYGSIASDSSTMSPCAPRGISGGDQAECRARWIGERRVNQSAGSGRVPDLG